MRHFECLLEQQNPTNQKLAVVKKKKERKKLALYSNGQLGEENGW